MTVATFCHYIPSPGVLSDHLCVLRKTCPTPACSHICSCHSKKGQCIIKLSCIGFRALNVRQMLQPSSHVDLPKPSCQPAVGAFCLLPLPRPAVCSLCCSIPDWILAQPSQHPPALQQGSPALNSSSETAWCTAKKSTITAVAIRAYLLCGLCGFELLHFLGQALDLELFVLHLILHISLCTCSKHVIIAACTSKID